MFTGDDRARGDDRGSARKTAMLARSSYQCQTGASTETAIFG